MYRSENIQYLLDASGFINPFIGYSKADGSYFFLEFINPQTNKREGINVQTGNDINKTFNNLKQTHEIYRQVF